MAANVKKAGQFCEMEFRDGGKKERGSIRKQKIGFCSYWKYESGCSEKTRERSVLWSRRAESRPLVRILKEKERARERERQVKRKGWNDLFLSSRPVYFGGNSNMSVAMCCLAGLLAPRALMVHSDLSLPLLEGAWNGGDHSKGQLCRCA